MAQILDNEYYIVAYDQSILNIIRGLKEVVVMEAVIKLNDTRTFTIKNPATGDIVGTYDIMNRASVDASVETARDMFSQWSKTSFRERKKIMYAAASVLSENADYYAGIVAAETGKTKLDALLADIYSVLDILKYYGKNAENFLKPKKVSGSLIFPGRKAYTIFEPKGVIGIISPWNYPFTLSAGPAISAIMSGNTVVLKPSSQTTGSGLILKEILEKGGLPPGVVNVVTGSGRVTGQALIENEDIDMFFFTGSTTVGKEVNRQAAKRLIPSIMELGGKDVAIVTKNADIERAAHGVLWGAMTNSGQTCIGTELALVDNRIYPSFMEALTRLLRNLKSGDVSGNVGSMTMSSQYKIVEDQLEDARQKGAKIISFEERDKHQKGLYFPPTLIENTTPDMKVRKEETFGPLLPVVPYNTLQEAIEIANSSEYGLSGAVFTTDMEEGRLIAGQLKTGSVNINDVLITYAMPSLAFGGVKKSGVGGYHGKSGIRSFTNTKSITEFGWKLKKEIFWYPVPGNLDKFVASALPFLYSNHPLKRLAAIKNMFFSLIKR